jgi:hypothetical protein
MNNLKGFGRKRSWPNFDMLSWNSPRETEDNHEKFQSGYLVSGPGFETRNSQIQSRSFNQSTMTFGSCGIVVNKLEVIVWCNQ